MEIKTLGELCSIVSGGTPARSKAEFWNEGMIPWIKIGNIKGKYVNKADEYITQAGLAGSSAKLLPKGTVLYTIFATLGEVGVLGIDACTNQAIAGLMIKDEKQLNTDYLYYYLKSKKSFVNSVGRGVAQNNINMSILRSFELPLPELSKQKDIIEILDKVATIIETRQQELQKLEDLIKARFVELFGDMFLNTMMWDEQHLESMADVISGITKGRKVKEKNLIEVPYMAVSNVKDGYIDWTTVKTIKATEQEINQYRLLPDDVLMTEGGDPDKVGRGAIIKIPLENCIHQNHIFRVRLNERVILPAYFAEYLQHQRAKRYFLGCAKQTTGIASINMKQLRTLPVLLPPMERQEQFADFVSQVNKSKLKVEESLKKMETLQKSLMQQYFG
mgnify:CR=1 FL=1